MRATEPLAAAGMARRLPVLTFHALDDRAAPISFPPALFRRAMAALRAAGWRTLTLSAADGWLARSSVPPGRTVVITFDDAYRSVYDVALPVLQEHGFTATLFVPTGQRPPSSLSEPLPALHGRPMATWAQLREMREAGIELAAHTMTHRDLTRLDDDEAEREIAGSKRLIEEVAGARVSAFAYPGGRHDPRVRALAGRHVPCACSDRLAFADAGDDRLALPRLDAYYLRHERWFRRLDGPSVRWYLGARALARRTRRAIIVRSA